MVVWLMVLPRVLAPRQNKQWITVRGGPSCLTPRTFESGGVARVVTSGPGASGVLQERKACSVLKVHRREWPKADTPLYTNIYK